MNCKPPRCLYVGVVVDGKMKTWTGVDEAARKIHAAELDSFSVAMSGKHDDDIRRALQSVIDLLESTNFNSKLMTVREKLRTAVSV